MRRSERREAELRRENDILALKAKEKSIIQRDPDSPNTEKTPPQAPERQVPRAAPRVTPRVIPREKDKPPEAELRRRRNENNGKNSFRKYRACIKLGGVTVIMEDYCVSKAPTI